MASLSVEFSLRSKVGRAQVSYRQTPGSHTCHGALRPTLRELNGGSVTTIEQGLLQTNLFESVATVFPSSAPKWRAEGRRSAVTKPRRWRLDLVLSWRSYVTRPTGTSESTGPMPTNDQPKRDRQSSNGEGRKQQNPSRSPKVGQSLIRVRWIVAIAKHGPHSTHPHHDTP